MAGELRNEPEQKAKAKKVRAVEHVKKVLECIEEEKYITGDKLEEGDGFLYNKELQSKRVGI